MKAAGTAFILPSVKWLADLGILFYGIVCRQPQARGGLLQLIETTPDRRHIGVNLALSRRKQGFESPRERQ